MAAAVPELRLWLARHGQSTANAGAAAVADTPLTEQGWRQAHALADRIDSAPDLLVISPLLRAVQTAAPVQARWPAVRCATWPIGEFTYLSPQRCLGTTADIRRPWIQSYWERCDPAHADGEGAESFAGFMARLQAFHRRLLGVGSGFVLVVGHGQFFRAYEMALAQGFMPSADAMRRFRAAETARPLLNGEILDLTQALTPFSAHTAA